MSEMPAASVLIPAYNRERFIGEAIESALAQATDFPFEVIVSDDGSTDGTVDVARGYGEQIRVIGDGVNRGAAAARNAGIKAARAPLIALLDSDDVMLSGRLQLQIYFLTAHPDVGVVTAACEHESGEPVSEYFARRGLTIPPNEWLVLDAPRAAIIRGFLGNQSTTTIRKLLLEEVGYYNTALATLEDWDLMFRLASHTKLACYNAPVAWIRTSHQGRLGHSSSAAIDAPDIWRALRDATADLTAEERSALEERYRTSIRGALSAGYFDGGRGCVREVLARYGSDVDVQSRIKWLTAGMMPAQLTRRLVELYGRTK